MRFSILRLFVLFFACYFLSNELHAQTLRGIAKRIEQEAAKRADKKVDEAIQKGFDKAEKAADEAVKSDKSSKPSEKSDQKGALLDLSKLLGAGNAEVKPQYAFDIGILYESYQQYGDEKEQAQEMTMWFSHKNSYLGNETNNNDQRLLAVIDESLVVVFNEANKSYSAMDFGFIGGMVKEMAKDPDSKVSVNVTNKTGKVKKKGTERFLGYSCQVYEVEDETSVSTVWVTEDLNFDSIQALGKASLSMLKNLVGAGSLPSESVFEISGTMLKSMRKDKEDGSIVVFEAKDILKGGKTIQTSAYSTK